MEGEEKMEKDRFIEFMERGKLLGLQGRELAAYVRNEQRDEERREMKKAG